MAVAACLWSTLPDARETRHVPGLAAPVSIAFDSHGVPHIRAHSLADAMAGLGFAHARDRMAQMELMRRTGNGTLSAIAGRATLPLDEMMRTLGLREAAEAEWAAMPEAPRRLLLAYASGVNAYLRAHGRFAAPETLLLGRPRPWTPVDTLLWGRLMAVWLSGNWRTELARLRLSGTHSRASLLSLWPGTPEAKPADAALDTRFARLPGFPDPFTEPDEESDEWAIAGRLSPTGAPLLAGDPHLAFGFPAIWYLARLDWPGGTLAGATAPGVPFPVIGRNTHIAWTFTTTGADTEDLFLERLRPNGRYDTPDGPRAFALRRETVAVRGRKPVAITVRVSRHGPIVSDLPGAGAPPGYALALASTAIQGGDAAAGLLALDQAADVGAAGRAAAMIAAPVQNLLVADRAHIALFTTGRVPIRRAGDGAFPVPGWTGADDWTGTASGAALPHFLDPASGRLLNGNERTVGPDFPVFLGRDFPGDWRARRIRALLDDPATHSLAGFAAMQADATSAFAQAVLPALRAVPAPPGLPARTAALLRGWNGRMAADGPQALVFNAWTQRFAALVLARADLPQRNGGAPWEDLVAAALGPARGRWCGGDCTSLLRQALAQSTAALSGRFGDDPAAWRWGRVHRAVFANPLLGALPLPAGLARRAVAVDGDDSTLFRGGNGMLGRFAARHGAAYRGVYDLADLDRSRFVVTPGQSGNPLSAYAWKLMRAWAKGDTIALPARPDRITSRAELLP